MNSKKRLFPHFPLQQTLRNYNLLTLRDDFIAGVTVAVMLIPQGMAYAMLAGLPPIIGLYASVVPLMVYALLGSSRHLAVGPVAMVSLLVATGVSEVAASGTGPYLQYSILLALMIGVIQFAMGAARLGFLVNFISHPVISGFTSAAALIIGFSQLKHLLGINLERSHHVHKILLETIQRFDTVHLPTLVIGGGSIALLVLLRRWKPAFPGALTVVFLGILTVSALRLGETGMKIVGEVPRGLPGFHLPAVDPGALASLLPIALAIALVSFMESISVAKAVAAKKRYPVDANQELIGLGAANIAGSFFQAYPVTGGFSRTAVNVQAGAHTSVASLITAAAIAITLLFFTPLFHNLPVAVLAAVIMVAVLGLVDIREFFHLWHIKRVDALMLLATFLATLFWGIEPGIATGVGLSFAALLVRTTRPHYAILGQLPGTQIYRNVKRYPEARQIDGIAIIRIDASFYFGNVNFLQEVIEQVTNDPARLVHSLVIDASSINDIDSSAEAALRSIWETLQDRGIELRIANIKGPVRDVLQRSGLYRALGAECFFFSVHDAVNAAADANRKPPLLSEARLPS